MCETGAGGEAGACGIKDRGTGSMENTTDSDHDTPPPSGETESDALEDPVNEPYSSNWSDVWDEAYLAQRRAHELRKIDPHLDACYHAIFGVAAWDATLAASLQEWPAFKRAQWAPKTLEEFYDEFGYVLRLFHQHNFIAEYEKAYARAKGVRIDFLVPTPRPDHVNTREALRRLYSLNDAVHAHDSRTVAAHIAHCMQVHENDTSALDSSIIDYFKQYRRRDAFDNVDTWVNEAPEYAVRPHPAPGAAERDQENRPPSPPRALRNADPPAGAAPPRVARRRPTPSLPERARMRGDTEITALLSRMQALHGRST